MERSRLFLSGVERDLPYNGTVCEWIDANIQGEGFLVSRMVLKNQVLFKRGTSEIGL